MHGQKLTEGNIPRQLWSLAWPMMLSMFFYTLYNLVDAFWVAKLSPEAIAAVSISQITLFAMISLSMGIAVGSAVLMGMSIGAGKSEEAERVLGQGYALSIIAAAIFTTIAYVGREYLLVLSGAYGDIYPLAVPYFTITALGSVFMFLLMSTSTAFNAQGDNFTPTKLFAISTAANVILDPIFIFGYGAFPALGIAGAAYATQLSQAVYLVLAIRVLMSDRMMIKLHMKNLYLKWDSVKEVFRIGIPASLTQTLNPLGFSALMFIVTAAFFEAGAAAFSIGFRIEFFAFIPAIGFGFGAMSLMGQNIGARNFDRVREIFKTVVLFAAGTAGIFSVLVFILAPFIVQVFTTDALVTEYTLQYFYIVPFGYVFFAVSFVEASVFQGLGRSWPGFWITLGRIGAAIAVAYVAVFVLEMPLWSVWCALVFGSVAASIWGYWWVRRALTHLDTLPVPDEHPASAEESMPSPVA